MRRNSTGIPVPRQSGFTLLEILVAMAVFTVFAVLAYGGLAAVSKQREQANAVIERTNAVQFAMRRIVADLSQLQPRPVREEFDDAPLPALLADARRGDGIQFTRSGWNNPLGLPRSDLQRVAYRIEDDVLYRVHWQALDRAPGPEPVEFELLAGVTDIELRFLGAGAEWTEQWPPLTSPIALEDLPRAVEIALELEDWGRISRTVEVASR